MYRVHTNKLNACGRDVSHPCKKSDYPFNKNSLDS